MTQASFVQDLIGIVSLFIVQLARLSGDEMSAVTNLEFLGVQVSKKPQSGVEKLALKFGARKVHYQCKHTCSPAIQHIQ
jgi:hypothetical protein